jgi:RNA polymerase sigma factor (sigma-70 family)
MTTLPQADRFLLERIRGGDGDAWTQLVDRFQGRLFAFARSRLRSADDAEDLVQETFISFLKGVDRYEERASLETYLFTILRRRIIDVMRGRHLTLCLLADAAGGDSSRSGSSSSGGGDRGSDPMSRIASDDPTASFYARRDESQDVLRHVLFQALNELVTGYKNSLNFRDLMITEMLFYAQLRNKVIAKHAGIREQHVALIKHRCLKQIREHVDKAGIDAASQSHLEDGLLTQVWEDYRLSCPKRSTIGAWMLGTLDKQWRDYTAFHVEELGCRFCQANLEDLKKQNEGRDEEKLKSKIMQSTVGFLRKG